MLKELISDEVIEPGCLTYWRASQVGMCETYLCHQRLGHEALPIPGRIRHVLEDGRTHERDIVTRLINKGIEVKHSCVDGQIEVCCSKSPYVTGHPDGILRVPKEQLTLDYADENFSPSRFCLLEITAPNHFTFLRLQKVHLRKEMYVKYVQVQMYLNSPEVRSYGNCAVAIVKNKNTSALYEEGISFDKELVEYELEKLRRLDFLMLGSIENVAAGNFRCSDWRRNTCRYRHLCFDDEESAFVPVEGILRGESLKEAETLTEVADVWRRGKAMEEEGNDMVQDARAQFRSVIEDYGCRGLAIEDVKALMIAEGTTRGCDFEVLKRKYPDVYSDKEVVTAKTRERYVRVT